MRTIQIAPYQKDCRMIGRRIIGTMNERTFVYELPSDERPYTEESMIANFCEAIALCSKQWQVEELLNNHWGIEGGKFWEE